MHFGRPDQQWMRLALGFGERGLGRTWPNPSVGCIIVRDNLLVGRGVTGDGGRPHAESVALKHADGRSSGATAYVTLEPCSHTGETGPCTELLIGAGVVRVVTPFDDPDERVSGKGHDGLRKAGIKVEAGCLEREAMHSHLGFLLRVIHGRPMVSLKLAHSLDGKLATGSGESKWISGPASRRLVHVLRARHDAVLVGRGTALADNPRLTPRGIGVSNLPVRIVLDTNLSTPEDSQLGRSARTGPVWMCHGTAAPEARREAWRATGAQTIECGASQCGRLDLADVMSRLAGRGLTRVFCEGGPELATSLVRDGLVDRLYGFAAGIALGSDAMAMFGDLDCTEIRNAHRFELRLQRRIGDDLLGVWSRPIASYGFRGRTC